MSITIHDTIEQHSDEWYELRRGIPTASTIGRLVTSTLKLADNETSRGLALTLAAERITGHIEHVHPTWEMRRGTDEEPVARDVYADNFNPVVEVGFITRQYDGYTIGFSPDGLVGDDGLIEIKSRSPRAQLATILADKVPAANMMQIQCGLMVTGRAWLDYVSFAGGLPLWVKRVHPDPATFAVLEQAAQKLETDIAEIIFRYNNDTVGLPMTERRPDIEELRF